MNYLCEDSPIGPVAVSVLYDAQTQQYIALLRTCEVRNLVSSTTYYDKRTTAEFSFTAAKYLNPGGEN
jgi:hypothetical protein